MPIPSHLIPELDLSQLYEVEDLIKTAVSKTVIPWVGEACGHRWATSLASRVTGAGCPFCSGNRVLAGFNDLATHNPEVAAEWDAIRNGLAATEIAPSSNRLAWWVCPAGHNWEARPSARVRGLNCVYCSGKKALPGVNDLATTHPDLAAEWNHAENLPLTLSAIKAGSNKKVGWICPRGHHYQMSVDSRTLQHQGCPFCSGNRVLAGFNDLATTHPMLAAQWHPTKNGILMATEVSRGSNRKVWWIGDCTHSWEATVAERVTGNDCPYCAGHRVLAGFNDLLTRLPEVAAQWHPTKNGSLQPQAVSHGSALTVWWRCNQGHEWQAPITGRKAYGCPVCARILGPAKKATPHLGKTDLLSQEPGMAAEWHPTKNGMLKPEEVNAGTSRKIWWQCDKGHEWQLAPSQRRYYRTGCPSCTSVSSKGELELVAYLEAAGVKVEQRNRTVLSGLELDIYLPEHKFAVEYNGLYWHSEERGKSKWYHHEKWQRAHAAGVQLVFVWEDDWERNPSFVKALLLHKLGLSKQETVYARKTVVQAMTYAQLESFFLKNHIQGISTGSHYLALVEPGEAEPLAALILKKEPGTDGKTLNIVRYATSVRVPGGFTKLLQFATREYMPEKFITFSDHGISDGGLYENNGFKADKELDPDYMYVVNGERQHKFGYRLSRFKNDPSLLWRNGLSERELARLNNIPKIWDAGKTRWALFCVSNVPSASTVEIGVDTVA